MEGDGKYPNEAGFQDVDTSKEAAAEIEADGRAQFLRDQVMKEYGKGSWTADEVAERLGESILSIRPRVTELYKQGLLETTDQRRKNGSGKAARVLRKKLEEDLFGAIPSAGDSVHAKIYGLVGQIVDKTGRTESSVRQQIGSMIKQHNPDAVYGALKRSESAKDPLTYARALLRGKPSKNDGLGAFLGGAG